MIDTIERAECRIYVACLASYNSGRLHGTWIDLDGKEESEVWNEINDMLARSPEPNVMRRKCPDCGTYQTDARPYRENSETCGECGETLPEEFSPSAEEWAVHDHEGFAGLITSEWPDIGEVVQMAEILGGDDEDAHRGLVYLVSCLGYSVADAVDKAEDVRTYAGRPEDYAAEFYEDCYSDALQAMPDFLRYHIDWEGVARDLLLGGDITEVEEGGERYLVTNASEF